MLNVSLRSFGAAANLYRDQILSGLARNLGPSITIPEHDGRTLFSVVASVSHAALRN